MVAVTSVRQLHARHPTSYWYPGGLDFQLVGQRAGTVGDRRVPVFDWVGYEDSTGAPAAHGAVASLARRRAGEPRRSTLGPIAPRAVMRDGVISPAYVGQLFQMRRWRPANAVFMGMRRRG